MAAVCPSGFNRNLADRRSGRGRPLPSRVAQAPSYARGKGYQVRRYVGLPLALFALAVLVTAFGGGQAQSGGQHGQVLLKAADGKLRRPVLTTTTTDGRTVKRPLPFLSASTVRTVQDALEVQRQDERLADADASAAIPNADFADIGGA